MFWNDFQSFVGKNQIERQELEDISNQLFKPPKYNVPVLSAEKFAEIEETPLWKDINKRNNDKIKKQRSHYRTRH